MNCIHESILRDVIGLVSDLGDEAVSVGDKLKNIFSKRRRSNLKTSIASMSAPLIMVFPVLTSTNLEIENASMISKAQERKLVEMVRLTLAANKISDARLGVEYLQQFHSNLRLSDYGVDDAIDAMEQLSSLAESNTIKSKDDRLLYDAQLQEKLDMVRYDLKNDNFYFLQESINDEPLSVFMVKQNDNSNVIKESDGPSDLWYREEQRRRREEATEQKDRHHRDNIGQKEKDRELADDKFKHQQDMDRISIRRGDEQDDHANRGMGRAMIDKNLMDSDVKKANELVSTTLRVDFISTSDKGKAVVNDSFYAGVKAKMHPIESYDIIDRLISKNKDLSTFQQLVKVSTGELSFFKDFLFAVDRAKIDALSQSRKGSSSKMWKVLERRANKQRLRKAIGSNSVDSISITTLVISKEEADILKRDHDLDIYNTSSAHRIMSAYNLMSLVIVDQANEIANFIYDTGEDEWETLSFKYLERENSDSGYKKVVSLLAKNK